MQFEDLRLAEPILRAVRAAGYRQPTPIQSSAIPHVLDGRDVLGCAQTGTGKTAAFALPILERLSSPAARPAAGAGKHTAPVNTTADRRSTRHGNRRGNGRSQQRSAGVASQRRIRALVLCPTRELAQQIHESFAVYGRHTAIRTAVLFGGVGQGPQVQALRAGAEVVIATPGRLIDLIGQGLVSLAGVEILVLDEADRMLDMGFLPDIRRLLAQIPRQRQSLLFSATMPAPIRRLADDVLNNPVPVQVARVSAPAPDVDHWVYHVEKPQKVSLLVHLLAAAPDARALVFTRTKHGADKLTRLLARSGVRAAALHGNKSQGARTRALDGFRSGQMPVLVATDLAARGLDVDDVAQVINYDLTPDPETYVHRIGRTGRAGASGTAVSFCTSEDRGDLRAIERLLGAPLQHASVPRLSNEPNNYKIAPTRETRQPAETQERPRRTDAMHRHRSRRKASRGQGRSGRNGRRTNAMA